MLSRERRINAPGEFRVVMRRGRKVTVKNLRVYVMKTDTPTRFGFIVSKAVSKRAVTRNLVKRRLRAAAANIELPSGFDVVVFALPTAAAATYTELEADLRTSLRLRR